MNKLPESQPVDVSVDSELTPISKEKINKVDKSGWHNATLQQLQDELYTLVQRKYAALEMCRPDIASQIDRGVMYLQRIISSKRPDE